MKVIGRNFHRSGGGLWPMEVKAFRGFFVG
jgi:hypothetical protein